MITKIPVYQKPIEFGVEPENSVQHWDYANGHYNNGDYRKSLLCTINFINANVLPRKDLDNDINIIQHHGSANIQIVITKETFEIKVPFLKIQNANKVAIMRRVAETNFNVLVLSQIVLETDTLTFRYKTSLDLCHPLKIFDVIREICIYADDYDDEFIEKYKAEYIEQPKVTQLSEAQQEKIWQSFQAIADQYEKYTELFEQKRWIGSVWDIMAISMLNLSNMSYIHGTLRTELERALAIHYNAELDGHYRIDQSKSFLRKLFHETSKEKFLENIYLAEKFVSVKGRSSVQILMSLFDSAKENIIKDLNEGNNFSAAYSMQCFFLKLMYDFNIDGKHEDAILNVLERAGGKECNVAARLLWDTYKGFLTGAIEGGPRKAGFLSKLFG